MFSVNKRVFLTKPDFDQSLLPRNAVSLDLWDDNTISTKSVCTFLDDNGAIEVSLFVINILINADYIRFITTYPLKNLDTKIMCKKIS